MSDDRFHDALEACPHCWDDGALLMPSAASKVFKDECVYCFASNSDGIFVCLKCHLGFCREHLHYHDRIKHPLYCFVHKKPKPERVEPITDLSQLGVEPPDEFDTRVACRPCMQWFPPDASIGLTDEIVVGVRGALSPQLQAAIADQGVSSFHKVCPHARTIVQPESRSFQPGRTAPTASEKCASCDHRTNNWMCLTCGSVGCPRAEAGGQQHAMLHFMMTGHPVVVKLGTVTAAGADVYCYSCDDEVRDENLQAHLAGLGIDMNTAVKTAKSMAELQLDQTAKFDFGKISEAGKNLVPRYGPGHTGFINLGNSCYMASVLQAVFAIPEFQRRFYSETLQAHQRTCAASPPDCYQCQLAKLGSGFFSGRHSAPNLPKHQQGISPRDFKTFITKGHRDFSTGEQQDAEEFLRYFLQTLSRKEIALRSKPTLEDDPAKLLEFYVEERSQCLGCQAVKYAYTPNTTLSFNIPVTPPVDPTGSAKPLDELSRPRVTLDECLSMLLMPGEFDCRCSGCGRNTKYQTSTRVSTFPTVFALHPRREYLDRTTLTTRKLDVFVEAPVEVTLERLRGTGPHATETLLADQSSSAEASAAAPAVEADEEGIALLLSMGIEFETAKWALQNTANNAERAVDWVFSHPEGPPPAVPVPAPTAAPTVQIPTAPTDGAAHYELFAMVSHIGSSALTGHYIAHVKKEGQWSICNDEKVAFSQEPPFSMASIYFYRRKASTA